MDKDKINEGDKVNIHFNATHSFFDCEVLYTPCATGDSWRIKTKKGDIIYVQQFEVMEKL